MLRPQLVDIPVKEVPKPKSVAEKVEEKKVPDVVKAGKK